MEEARPPQPGEQLVGLALCAWLLGLRALLLRARLAGSASLGARETTTAAFCGALAGALAAAVSMVAAALGCVMVLRGRRAALALWKGICTLWALEALWPPGF